MHFLWCFRCLIPSPNSVTGDSRHQQSNVTPFYVSQDDAQMYVSRPIPRSLRIVLFAVGCVVCAIPPYTHIMLCCSYLSPPFVTWGSVKAQVSQPRVQTEAAPTCFPPPMPPTYLIPRPMAGPDWHVLTHALPSVPCARKARHWLCTGLLRRVPGADILPRLP